MFNIFCEQDTFAFFQFEMQGGIFHSCCSLTVIYKKGEQKNLQLHDSLDFSVNIRKPQKAEYQHFF